MKTVKLSVLILLILTSSLCYAQTKEETIAWLTLKLEKHFTYYSSILNRDQMRNIQLIYITECEIQVSYELRLIGCYDWEAYTVIFPTKGFSINKNGRIVYKTAVVQSGDHILSDSPLLFISRNRNYKRIQKAIAYLAEFCNK